MLNIALIGASGKMGTQITAQIAAKPNLYCLSYAVVNTRALAKPELVQTAGVITENTDLVRQVDAVIDFSTPNASIHTIEHCLTLKTPLVLGTTGFNPEQKSLIEKASKDIAILMTPNFSLSVNMLFKLTEIVASKLADFETEVVEAHHRYKKDSPSGTAIKLGEIIAEARNIDFNKHAKYSRHGVDESRQPQDIGFSVIRGGDIVGQHDVLFINDGETLSLKSEISNRGSFAHGSLIAAAFIATQPPGLYNMLDVLHL